ncbi:1-acyl-sn-glycerol-3-phosphate acyltransferase [Candidatus Laterigemmans baculatus]|uniref:1-acyl-sn-glycerol-3-phosphate acyltransferase n=1 Tax=Candidatus Laterigemmans baculatus TaxID=2770505 RepID=UPI0013DC3C06|nr:1-acyl-sn-glycerol-3-phosphate acyltransferase [Candidatus Laterigemmans baculatus]
MSVVVEKPYRFVPPHRGNLWPSLIQRTRLVDRYLRKKDGVVSHECRHLERLGASLRAGHGILLTPNHCRYADPLVLGWLSRELDQHLYAMASWHLFNASRFDMFSLPKMGAFSIWREGVDRQSIETAIQILADAERPLLIFPEGTTNRTNDIVRPLLDGPTFVARAAARRRAKAGSGQVVIHPLGIKYLFRGDIEVWADGALAELERHLSWHPRPELPLLPRIARVAEGLLALKEVEHFGHSQSGSLESRRDALVEFLMHPIERRYVGEVHRADVLTRVRTVRSKLVPLLLDPAAPEEQRQQIRRAVADVDLVQQLDSYPSGYLDPSTVTDTRVLETIERLQEDALGKSRWPGPLHAVMEVGTAIEVPAERTTRGGSDPLLDQIGEQLREMLGRLAAEANPLRRPVVPATAMVSRLSLRESCAGKP